MTNCTIRKDTELEPKDGPSRNWTVEMSIFKDYLKEEKPGIYNKCFEFDWTAMKQIKYKKSNPDDVKNTMKECYRKIYEIYKVQSGFSPQGGIFSIGQNQMNMFMNELGCLDDDESGKLKPSDSDRMFITVNAGKKGTYVPAKNLVRFQFVEFLIRCAIEKFYQSKIVETEHEAVQRFCDEYIVKYQ